MLLFEIHYFATIEYILLPDQTPAVPKTIMSSLTGSTHWLEGYHVHDGATTLARGRRQHRVSGPRCHSRYIATHLSTPCLPQGTMQLSGKHFQSSLSLVFDRFRKAQGECLSCKEQLEGILIHSGAVHLVFQVDKNYQRLKQRCRCGMVPHVFEPTTA